MDTANTERRGSQRIVTATGGQPRFWLSWQAGRVALGDLSVDGFAMAVSTPPASDRPFEFRLEREGQADSVDGLAQVVNFVASVGGGLAGCRFVGLAEDARRRIAGWLADHVVQVASIPLASEEAERIVLGPSIV